MPRPMNRPLRRLLALVATVLVATGVTVAAYLNGTAEVERLSHEAAEPPAPGVAEDQDAPRPKVQVRADLGCPAGCRAG